MDIKAHTIETVINNRIMHYQNFTKLRKVFKKYRSVERTESKGQNRINFNVLESQLDYNPARLFRRPIIKSNEAENNYKQ